MGAPPVWKSPPMSGPDKRLTSETALNFDKIANGAAGLSPQCDFGAGRTTLLFIAAPICVERNSEGPRYHRISHINNSSGNRILGDICGYAKCKHRQSQVRGIDLAMVRVQRPTPDSRGETNQLAHS